MEQNLDFKIKEREIGKYKIFGELEQECP